MINMPEAHALDLTLPNMIFMGLIWLLIYIYFEILVEEIKLDTKLKLFYYRYLIPPLGLVGFFGLFIWITFQLFSGIGKEVNLIWYMILIIPSIIFTINLYNELNKNINNYNQKINFRKKYPIRKVKNER